MIQDHFNPDVFINLSEHKVSQMHLIWDFMYNLVQRILKLAVKNLVDKNLEKQLKTQLK